MKQTYIARCLTLEFSDPKMRREYFVFKIGSSYQPEKRVQMLSKDKFSDYYGESFILEATYPLNIENTLHRAFNGRRLTWGLSRELFYFSPSEMDGIIKDYGFTPVGWTIEKKHNFNNTGK